MLKTHWGPPISAAISTSGSTAPSVDERYRFHQPVRSLMNVSDPPGCQAGSLTDSSAPPAINVALSAPASPTSSLVPAHGMFGWSHSSQHSLVPSTLQLGLET